MNKFISDNIAVFVIIGVALAAVALGMAIANRRKIYRVGVESGVIAPRPNEKTQEEAGQGTTGENATN